MTARPYNPRPVLVTQEMKTQLNRIRRAAQRQGLTVVKVKRYDPRAKDFGHVIVHGPHGGVVVRGTPDKVEKHLARDRTVDRSVCQNGTQRVGMENA